MYVNRDTETKLTKTTLILHWTVALITIGMISVGIYMVETKTYSLYGIHKSIGIIAFVLILYRLLWRMKNGWKSVLSENESIYKTLAAVSRFGLLLGTILMPLTGILVSILEGRGLSVFGFRLLGIHDPELTGKAVAINMDMAKLLESMHSKIGYVLAGLIIIHILAALKHHFIDKNKVLRRMLGRV